MIRYGVNHLINNSFIDHGWLVPFPVKSSMIQLRYIEFCIIVCDLEFCNELLQFD